MFQNVSILYTKNNIELTSGGQPSGTGRRTANQIWGRGDPLYIVFIIFNPVNFALTVRYFALTVRYFGLTLRYFALTLRYFGLTVGYFGLTLRYFALTVGYFGLVYNTHNYF